MWEFEVIALEVTLEFAAASRAARFASRVSDPKRPQSKRGKRLCGRFFQEGSAKDDSEVLLPMPVVVVSHGLRPSDLDDLAVTTASSKSSVSLIVEVRS
mmetsp:Transcript_28582/g.77449  ORF Transcript_28582/g.77449 Transcript_28582/m.77449 type:complete len:99 (-) Transcript_28582:103-399(-)|eukprot:CAMPEP_0171161892 /NCGR_PEP_ID=MMETSP0790-20130122/4308_1 /TAXON_ID=2925 /ORGANISM="Alexandrium catenella, Strain OF101" /LENGTH=98 /DNA_ID=CAMNT_0011626473 /DNA_START=174 /DNA_END=470 /DNA_ORIENTATION=-